MLDQRYVVKHISSETDYLTNFSVISFSKCPVVSLHMLSKSDTISGFYWWVQRVKDQDINPEFDDQDANAWNNKTYLDKLITNQFVSSWATGRPCRWSTLRCVSFESKIKKEREVWVMFRMTSSADNEEDWQWSKCRKEKKTVTQNWEDLRRP